MNKTILTIGIALIMLGLPASAKVSPAEETKAELGEEIGVTNASCPLGSGVHSIGLNSPITSSLPAVIGASCEFRFDATVASDVLVKLTGLQSDFDLYTKKNAIPTTTIWDCRPYSGGTTAETCGATLAAGDFAGIMVRRYSGSGSFTVTVEPITTLENGVPVAVNVAQGAMPIFKFVVPAGATQANFAIAGDMTSASCNSGAVCAGPDADLYVRKTLLPTTFGYTCRPYAYGNVESCTFSSELRPLTGTNPVPTGAHRVLTFSGPGTYYVAVRGFAGTSDVVLQASTA